jgi:hypothetical protein
MQNRSNLLQYQTHTPESTTAGKKCRNINNNRNQKIINSNNCSLYTDITSNNTKRSLLAEAAEVNNKMSSGTTSAH